MKTNRLEAFTDGVFAIIITIMVLELKAPHNASLDALVELWPVFLSYVISFIYIAIYWNNHHHLMHLVVRVNGGVLWANNHLLFWLSLVPFATAWMGENRFAQTPTIVYAASLLMPAVAFSVLQFAIVRSHADDARLAAAIGVDMKGKASIALYCAAILGGFVSPAVAIACCVAVAGLWLIPDRRIERSVQSHPARVDE